MTTTEIIKRLAGMERECDCDCHTDAESFSHGCCDDNHRDGNITGTTAMFPSLRRVCWGHYHNENGIQWTNHKHPCRVGPKALKGPTEWCDECSCGDKGWLPAAPDEVDFALLLKDARDSMLPGKWRNLGKRIETAINEMESKGHLIEAVLAALEQAVESEVKE